MHVIRRMPGGTPLLRRTRMRIPKPLSRTDPGGMADDIQEGCPVRKTPLSAGPTLPRLRPSRRDAQEVDRCKPGANGSSAGDPRYFLR
jgi:hypothetical protein